MIDFCLFYSAKVAVVFILMISSPTLEAQRNENDKFFNLMAAIGEHFSGEFNEAEKALELDLNGANSFLGSLHAFATLEIVTKNENGEFECIASNESKKSDFIKAIKAILGEKSDKDVRNLLKAISLPKKYDFIKAIKTIFDDKSFKKLEDLIKEISEKFSEEQLFNLLFSFAARLEALVHGKNFDGTLKEKQENSKEKIQTFLAVSKCFILPEWELSIFDYWIEIIEMKTKNSQKPIFGVAIYKETSNKYKNENKEKAFKLSKENYKFLKQLNDQKFSIYESTNLLRAAFNWGYSPRIPRGIIPQIFLNLLNQINSVFYFKWEINEYLDKNKKCEYAMFFQNISENLMKMISDKGIDPELHLDSQDKKIQEYVQKDVEESCKKFDNEEEKMLFLNNVRYDLAINFEFNQRKDIYDRAEDLLSKWVGHRDLSIYGIEQISEESYLKKNASQMLRKIKHFTSNTNRETISIIDALIGKEHIDQFNLGALFDQIKLLVEVAIPEEQDKFWKAKKEINTKQLEKDIKFWKNNPKRIAEEKYKKAVAIICTIKQHGEKVKMLVPNIKNIEFKTKMIELSSTIQKNEMKYFGPELWKQTKEFCKIEQIEIEETVSEEILLKDLQFEFDQIWNRFGRVLEAIEEYYLSIPLMQLIEKARTLAKTFGKMLEKVKEHYTKSIE